MLLTLLFLPDTTGLDLKEQERRWQFIRAGREQDYHGVAVHPQHLSLYERIRGVGKFYDAELDYKQRIEEMRGEWEEAQNRRATEKEGAFDDDLFDESIYSSDVSNYFQKTSRSPNLVPNEKTRDQANGEGNGVNI